jgi:kynurenine formamidase
LRHIIDLTRQINSNTKVFPGSPQPTIIAWSKIDIQGYDSEVVFLSTHTSTHMDAPSHFVANASSIELIDVRRLICNAVLIKTEKKRRNELIVLEDVVNSKNEIQAGETVVFSTGWDDEVTSEDYFTSNPGLSPEVAKYLVEKKINAAAIDSPSIDPGYDHSFTCHKILLSRDIFIVENLCNLSKINKQKFTMIVAPLKFTGATGSPVRAISIEE